MAITDEDEAEAIRDGAELWREYCRADGYWQEQKAYRKWHSWRKDKPFRMEQKARKEAGK